MFLTNFPLKKYFAKVLSVLSNHFIDMRTTVDLFISCRKNVFLFENFNKNTFFLHEMDKLTIVLMSIKWLNRIERPLASVWTKHLMFSVWWSKLYFFSQFLAKFFAKIIPIYSLISYFFIQIYKDKKKGFKFHKTIRNYEKSNAWNIRRLMSRWFHRPSNQAYYIDDCQISCDDSDWLKTSDKIRSLYSDILIMRQADS